MLIPQPITQFNGFGREPQTGRYTYSSGLKRTEHGIAPSWRIKHAHSLDREHYWFAQIGNDLYSVGADGDIYKNGTLLQAVGSSGNGLIVDQHGRLLYARGRYIGMYNLSTFEDEFADTGLTTSLFRPMETYEDLVLIGNQNNVAVLFTADDSLSPDAFSLPSGFVVRAIKAGRTGILIGAYFQNRGYLILWDGYSPRSIAPWIPLPDAVLAITSDESGRWIVATRNAFYQTDGYTIAPYAELPVTDEIVTSISSSFWRGNILPAGMVFKNRRLYVNYTPDSLIPRLGAGTYIRDERTGLWEFVPVPKAYWGIPDDPGDRTGSSAGALFLNPLLGIEISYGTTDDLDDIDYGIGQLEEATPRHAELITERLGADTARKYADRLTLSVGYDLRERSENLGHDWTITTKIADDTRPLFGYGVTSEASTELDELVNTGTNAAYRFAQVGDEVTILNGANAGEIRHITAITDATTDDETWTLDSALPQLTEEGVSLQVTPFRPISEADLREDQDYLFNIKDKPKATHFYIKTILDSDNDNNVIPVIQGGELIFDDHETV